MSSDLIADNIARCEAALASVPPGVTKIVVDGQVTDFDRQAVVTELEYWQGRRAKAAGKRPWVRPITIGGIW